MASAMTGSPQDPDSITYIGPDASDPRNAASVRIPLTSLVRATSWLRGVIGGTISFPVGLLSNLAVNGSISSQSQVSAPVGDFPVVKTRARAIYGAGGSTTYFASDYDLVYNDASGAAITSGTIWQIQTGAYFAGQTIRFANLSIVNAVSVRDPSGIPLVSSLKNASGFAFSVTCMYTGTFWAVVDLSYRP